MTAAEITPVRIATVGVEILSGDAARWAIRVDGRTVASCGNAATAHATAARIRRELEREARTKAIRMLADYLEQHPEAPCESVTATTWANGAKELAELAARTPGALLDNSCDILVRVGVPFGAGVTLEAIVSRRQFERPAPKRALLPELAAIPTRDAA